MVSHSNLPPAAPLVISITVKSRTALHLDIHFLYFVWTVAMQKRILRERFDLLIFEGSGQIKRPLARAATSDRYVTTIVCKQQYNNYYLGHTFIVIKLKHLCAVGYLACNLCHYHGSQRTAHAKLSAHLCSM